VVRGPGVAGGGPANRLAAAIPWPGGEAADLITDALSTPEAGQDPGDDGDTAT
jgi:hypothetical protein